MQLPDILKQAHIEGGYPPCDIPEGHYDQLISTFSTDSDKFMASIDGVGLIAGGISESLLPLPGTRVAVQVFWYVLPEHRNSGAGLDLYYQFIEWAVEQECQYVMQEYPTKGCFKVANNYMRKLDV